MKKKIKILLATLGLAGIMLFGNMVTADASGLMVQFYEANYNCKGYYHTVTEFSIMFDGICTPFESSHKYPGGIICYQHVTPWG